MIIYKLTNLINGKVYIGQTSRSLEKRMYMYKYSEKHLNYGSGQLITKAIRKYGFKNFLAETIEECSKEIINEREIYWIKYFDSTVKGYNIALGGKNPWLNPSAREKIIAAISVPCTESRRQKISATLMGHGFSLETLKKMSLAKLGKPSNNPNGGRSHKKYNQLIAV